jgi:hypothetical protein
MNNQANIELRLRTMRILWIALLMSIPIYYVFTLLRGPSENIAPNRTLSLVLLGVAVSTTLISFLIRNSLLSKASDRQQLPMVQQAYIVTWAITEVAALLGMLDFFVTGDRYCYLLFIIAVLGMLLHYPRRDAVLNAAFKS